MQALQTCQPVYSAYANDKQMSDLIAIFVGELSSRVDTLRSHAEEEDWESVCRVAHQLNECASSYGFARLSTLAARLEATSRVNPERDQVNEAIMILAEYSESVRPGSPE